MTEQWSGGEWVISGARIVLADAVVTGSVRIVDGKIADIDTGAAAVPGAFDFEGDYLIPGLVEIHTDNLEKHFLPRPGVIWPSGQSAALAHDTQIIGAGITTVFDALAVGDYHAGGLRRRIFDAAIEAIRTVSAADLFRAEHLIHLRCEVSDPHMLEMFEPLVDEPLVRFVSVMDHTPGQRQWNDVEKFREFNAAKAWTDDEVAAEVAAWKALQQRYSEPNRRSVLELCRPRGLAIASHDDTEEWHVDEAVADGIRVSEFPTTRRAAEKARSAGLSILMGAPNVVRGGSHSGNVSASELAEAGLLDGLSSDYVPVSLLHAAFQVGRIDGVGLPSGISLVTANTADMVGLEDRGRIAPGKRADLLRVAERDGAPVVRSSWRGGGRIL